VSRRREQQAREQADLPEVMVRLEALHVRDRCEAGRVTHAMVGVGAFASVGRRTDGRRRHFSLPRFRLRQSVSADRCGLGHSGVARGRGCGSRIRRSRARRPNARALRQSCLSPQQRYENPSPSVSFHSFTFPLSTICAADGPTAQAARLRALGETVKRPFRHRSRKIPQNPRPTAKVV